MQIGKLSLYVAAGGIHPQRVLPVTIDVGTNNAKLLNDPLYIGLQQPRVRGDEYYSIIDEFMRAVNLRWPGVLVQFEDFENAHALPILEKYRYKHLCFNDDIQGTGAVALAGIVSAIRARGGTKDDLPNERIVVCGAGSAGLGVTNSLAWTMVSELGIRAEEAFKQFYLVDMNGLLGQGRPPNPAQMRYIRSDLPDNLPLVEVIKKVKPTVLLGLTGQGGLFSEESIREMYKHCKHPIIFPLSNPTSHAECTAEQAYEWTEGNAIFSSGSPFPPVDYKGKTLYPSQGNNMYIFPAVGLAAILTKSRRVSYRMLNRAGLALSNTLTMEEINQGRLYPHINRIRQVTVEVASAVARAAFGEGLAGIKEPPDLEKFIENSMYLPEYAPIIFNPTEHHNGAINK
jgi:malate dehydrogenase (oxaloacetate-decarboxylating)(NADP+)